MTTFLFLQSQGADAGLKVGEENWEPASFEIIPNSLKLKGKRVRMHPCEPDWHNRKTSVEDLTHR